MSIHSRALCIVCGFPLMHCRCATGPCVHSGAAAVIAALRAQVEELKQKYAFMAADAEQYESRAIRAEAERERLFDV